MHQVFAMKQGSECFKRMDQRYFGNLWIWRKANEL